MYIHILAVALESEQDTVMMIFIIFSFPNFLGWCVNWKSWGHYKEYAKVVWG
jgi:hypothetical protein